MKQLEIYGDSVLRGVVYQADSGRYTLYSRGRLPSFAENGITVKNYARMGATVARGAELLSQHLSPCPEDTVVLFEYGGNDCDYLWEAISADPHGQFLPKTPEEKYLATYRDMILYARSRGATPVIASLVPIDAEKYMRWISCGLNYENILSWLGDVSMLSRWQEHYSHMAEQLAREMDCPLLDLRRAFLTAHDFKNLLCEDGIHPTPRGHARIDAALEQFFLA